MRIVLVDDDAELCALLTEFLKREGFTVECALDGHLGLERAARAGVDLVVLDVMLPGIDGFEILRRLRQQSKVPVMMLTARGEDVDRIIGLDLGADDYLWLSPLTPASWRPASAPSCGATSLVRRRLLGAWKCTASRSTPARARCFPGANPWS